LNSNPDPVADSDGSFIFQFNLPDWFIASYTATATGPLSGVASTTFTDTANVVIDNRNPNANSRPWFRAGAVSTGYDVTVSGTYTCTTGGSGTAKCASPISVVVDICPSNGGGGV
jgi:hypothetical protein